MIRIEARRGLQRLQFDEVLKFRGLLGFLVWRDLKVRYKQTAFRIAWIVVQPVLMMVIFSIFFGRLIHVPSDGVAYPIFLFAGLLPWTLFASGVSTASQSVVAGAHLITKVYFPRVLLPVAAVLAGLVDFLIAFLVLIALMIRYDVHVTAQLAWVPLLVVLAVVTTLAASLWLGALNVRYRDIQTTLPFLVQLWFFATPVVYPSNLVHGTWSIVYALNPMVGVVDGFRAALLGRPMHDPAHLVIALVVAGIGLVSGLVVFRSLERSFADWV